jgi:adenine deaminase
MIVEGNIVDIENRKIYAGSIHLLDGKILNIEPNNRTYTNYILPGFIDAHVHIESSMLMPAAFAQEAVKHGTIATISDPHEIANVLGVEGIQFYIDNAKQTPFKVFFGAPSCVPATGFETAGAVIDAEQTATLMQSKDIWYLAEMMNFPGVIDDDAEVHKKIKTAHAVNKVVDGHAPGLRGEALIKYLAAGITTDHECFTYEEGKEKAEHGVKILIREGSAAKNYEALIPLIKDFPKLIMFCSDDKHPDDLLLGHINKLVARAVSDGYDLYDVLHAACLAPMKHYSVPVGTLQVGSIADMIVVNNLIDFDVQQTILNGEIVFENGVSKIQIPPTEFPNNFNCNQKVASDFKLRIQAENLRVIEAHDGQLITTTYEHKQSTTAYFSSDIEYDILQIAVINRYQDAPVANALIKGFGLKKGAIASTVAHDSHNIICVGTSAEEMCIAVNALVKSKGGIVVFDGTECELLPLPIAGLISAHDAAYVAEKYSTLTQKTKALGSQLHSPFMTLSFMALLVIPELKLSDKGLFDGKTFQFASINISS